MEFQSDLLVVGAGPAGLAASVNGASEGLSVISLERLRSVGGQASSSSRIENYLGFPVGLSGARLAKAAHDQAVRFGVEIHTDVAVIDLRTENGRQVVTCANGSRYIASSVVLACGVNYRTLDVPGIERLIGRGVEIGMSPRNAASFRGKQAVVVGGANSAGQAAIFLASHGCRVLIVSRSPLEKSMSSYLLERCKHHRLIVPVIGARVGAVHGDHAHRLAGVTLVSNEGVSVEQAAGMFVFIGSQPRTEWATTLARDDHGFIQTDGKFETNVPGVFAVGDVRSGSVKRVAAAAGEGSMAIQHVHTYLGELV